MLLQIEITQEKVESLVAAGHLDLNEVVFLAEYKENSPEISAAYKQIAAIKKEASLEYSRSMKAVSTIEAKIVKLKEA